MLEINICLVGSGPRALVTLNALNRHITKFRKPNLRYIITIVDPNAGGTGCHDPHQPEYLYTNTLASQVTAFYPTADDPSWITGPSFTEWASNAGIYNINGRYDHACGSEGVAINTLEYLPRYLLGQYLAWSFRHICNSFPKTVLIQKRNVMAINLQKTRKGQYRISLADNSSINADYVFISTGHSQNVLEDEGHAISQFVSESIKTNPNIAFFPQSYPLNNLEPISHKSTVAIQGLGLTAWDVIAQLTEGRGGTYVNDGSNTGQIYKPSGREPKLIIYSRQSLPSVARGINQKGLKGRHSAQFFTRKAITDLRRSKKRSSGCSQLDFEKDVLPILHIEMAYAYRTSVSDQVVEAHNFSPTAHELDEIKQIFEPLNDREYSTFDDYRKTFTELVTVDLKEAEKGNLSSPIKAATDVIRDTRSTICEAVEFNGLTGESEKWFRRKFAPIMNRISYGPPKFRNHQLLALFESGTIDLAGGPNSKLILDKANGKFRIQSSFAKGNYESTADVLVFGRLDQFKSERSKNLFLQSLIRNGIFRPACNGEYKTGGLDITRNCNPIGKNSHVSENIWVLGYPTEGPIFYTHALPRTAMPSQQHKLADECVENLFSSIEKQYVIFTEPQMEFG